MQPIKSAEEKWIWAVDAFHEDPSSQWRALDALKGVFWENPLIVQPVSCLSFGDYDQKKNSIPTTWHGLASRAKEEVEALLAQRTEEQLLPPRFIQHDNPSEADEVERLIHFALEQGAHGIALTSHARRGPARVLLGSFAETLISKSPLPVLVVNPKAREKTKLKTVVFPTDFSDASADAFHKSLLLAAREGARLILFHKLRYLSPEIGNFAPAVGTDLNPIVASEEETRAVADNWIRKAKFAGVEASAHLDFKYGRVLESLLTFVEAEGEGTLVSMASTSGPARALFMGSLARQMLRYSPQPVLIFHAEQETLVKAFLARAARVVIAFGANAPIR